ncbi:MAG: hypothetical protein JWQ87_4646 [Candidatus Sulfotelmatobacter sp.]|nr:hypothetical protein [Candidatus Sulfotelmatobacter sp.]
MAGEIDCDQVPLNRGGRYCETRDRELEIWWDFIYVGAAIKNSVPVGRFEVDV